MLPDSPVTAEVLTPKQRRMAIERLRENQPGIEHKHLKGYQVKEASMDYKLYLVFILALVGNVPKGGISNFGAIILKSFGFSTLVTTLMQVAYVSHRMEVVVVVILTLWFLLARENKRRDPIQGEEEGLEGRDLDATAFSDMTDRENLKYVPLLIHHSEGKRGIADEIPGSGK
ncbi:MAG: hypothetical protein Q9166_005734 [cf. Caloplaca sp. 2 TL-2023]